MAAIKGTNVIAPVVPLDTTDVHPSHEARYGKGGYRTVATLVERDAIPAPRREAGMLVYVSADGGSLWQLGGDLTTWTAFESGGSADLPPGTEGDVLTYVDGEWVAAEPQGGVSSWNDLTDRPTEFPPEDHAASHLHGAADAIFNQNLNTTDAPTFVGLSLYNTTAISEENSGPTLVVHSSTDQSYRQIAVGMKYVDGTPYGVIRTYGNDADVPGVRIESNVGLTALWCKSVAFDDATVQTTAWPGTLSYTALTDPPTLGTAAAEDATAFAAATHGHSISDVTGLQTALDGKQPSGSYAAAVHTHVISDVTGLQTALNGKAAASHGHAIADVAGLQLALDGKQASGSYAAATHGHTSAAISDFASAVVAAAPPPTTDASLLTQGTLSAYRLPTSGVAAGTYTSVTVDTYGRVTAGSTPSIAYSSLTGLPTLGGAASLNVGTTAGTVAAGDDARLSDARTPTAHNQAWSTITSTPTTRSGYGITDAQKTITSGTAAPTGGVDGDIYLQYT